METPEEQPLIAQAAGDIPGDLVAVARTNDDRVFISPGEHPWIVAGRAS